MQRKLPFKKHDLAELAEGLHVPERFCHSQDKKKKNHKDVHEKGI